ncbi:MAG: hypothetical protein IAE89_08090 [Anaerolineae bacterium]|nr:hypothetical protein [Anaerolineae bacterium]
MKSRAFTTIAVWLIVMGSISAFVNNLTRVIIVDYVEYTQTIPNFRGEGTETLTSQMPVYDTLYAPDIMMIFSAIIVLVLIIAAAVATLAIWKNASEKAALPPVNMQAENRPQSRGSKMKPDQRQRALMLLESLSSEELDSLEQAYLTDGTGETISLYALAEQERARSNAR